MRSLRLKKGIDEEMLINMYHSKEVVEHWRKRKKRTLGFRQNTTPDFKWYQWVLTKSKNESKILKIFRNQRTV